MLNAIDGSAVAALVRDSEVLTAVLSALHAIGYTVIMGGAIFCGLRLTGACFRDRPAADVVGPASRAIGGGLMLSVVTGALLFAPRAVSAGGNSRFQLKMALLVAASTFHFGVVKRAALVAGGAGSSRALGALALFLWTWLAITACAFILLE